MQHHIDPIPVRDLEIAATLLSPVRRDLTPAALLKAVETFDWERHDQEGRRSPERLLRKSEACRLLGISLSTIDRMLRDGQLTKVMVRGNVRIPEGAISKLAMAG